MTMVQTSSAGSHSSTREEVKADADRLAGTAKRRASEEAEKRKGEAARTAHCASDALHKAATHLDNADEAPAWLASAFRSAASTIDSMAGKVEGRSAEDLGRNASRFARDNPAAFIAASAAAGFAAARFLRAGAEFQHHEQPDNFRRDGGASSDFSTGLGTAEPGASNNERFARETRSVDQAGAVT